MEIFSQLSLNYDTDKHMLKHEENEIINQETLSENDDFPVRTFELISQDNSDELEIYKKKIQELSMDRPLKKGLSFGVIDQCLFLIDELNPLSLKEIDLENIYPTELGTVIFDWEKDRDNVFSLEIGLKSIGYFIEVEGKDVKQVDDVVLKDHINILINDLNRFLNDC